MAGPAGVYLPENLGFSENVQEDEDLTDHANPSSYPDPLTMDSAGQYEPLQSSQYPSPTPAQGFAHGGFPGTEYQEGSPYAEETTCSQTLSPQSLHDTITVQSTPQTTVLRPRRPKQAQENASVLGPTKSKSSRVTKAAPRPRGRRKKKDNDDEGALPDSLQGALTDLTSHLPADLDIDIDAYVNRSDPVRQDEVEKSKDRKIKRPMNAFMLYRKAFQNRTKKLCGESNHQKISVLCGNGWSAEPTEIKARFIEFAQIERRNHSSAFPAYKFTPSKSKKSRAREVVEDVEEDEEEDEVLEEYDATAQATGMNSPWQHVRPPTAPGGKSPLPYNPASQPQFMRLGHATLQQGHWQERPHTMPPAQQGYRPPMGAPHQQQPSWSGHPRYTPYPMQAARQPNRPHQGSQLDPSCLNTSFQSMYGTPGMAGSPRSSASAPASPSYGQTTQSYYTYPQMSRSQADGAGQAWHNQNLQSYYPGSPYAAYQSYYGNPQIQGNQPSQYHQTTHSLYDQMNPNLQNTDVQTFTEMLEATDSSSDQSITVFGDAGPQTEPQGNFPYHSTNDDLETNIDPKLLTLGRESTAPDASPVPSSITVAVSPTASTAPGLGSVPAPEECNASESAANATTSSLAPPAPVEDLAGDDWVNTVLDNADRVEEMLTDTGESEGN